MESSNISYFDKLKQKSLNATYDNENRESRENNSIGLNDKTKQGSHVDVSFCQGDTEELTHSHHETQFSNNANDEIPDPILSRHSRRPAHQCSEVFPDTQSDSREQVEPVTINFLIPPSKFKPIKSTRSNSGNKKDFVNKTHFILPIETRRVCAGNTESQSCNESSDTMHRRWNSNTQIDKTVNVSEIQRSSESGIQQNNMNTISLSVSSEPKRDFSIQGSKNPTLSDKQRIGYDNICRETKNYLRKETDGFQDNNLSNTSSMNDQQTNCHYSDPPTKLISTSVRPSGAILNDDTAPITHRRKRKGERTLYPGHNYTLCDKRLPVILEKSLKPYYDSNLPAFGDQTEKSNRHNMEGFLKKKTHRVEFKEEGDHHHLSPTNIPVTDSRSTKVMSTFSREEKDKQNHRLNAQHAEMRESTQNLIASLRSHVTSADSYDNHVPQSGGPSLRQRNTSRQTNEIMQQQLAQQRHQQQQQQQQKPQQQQQQQQQQQLLKPKHQQQNQKQRDLQDLKAALFSEKKMHKTDSDESPGQQHGKFKLLKMFNNSEFPLSIRDPLAPVLMPRPANRPTQTVKLGELTNDAVANNKNKNPRHSPGIHDQDQDKHYVGHEQHKPEQPPLSELRSECAELMNQFRKRSKQPTHEHIEKRSAVEKVEDVILRTLGSIATPKQAKPQQSSANSKTQSLALSEMLRTKTGIFIVSIALFTFLLVTEILTVELFIFIMKYLFGAWQSISQLVSGGPVVSCSQGYSVVNGRCVADTEHSSLHRPHASSLFKEFINPSFLDNYDAQHKAESKYFTDRISSYFFPVVQSGKRRRVRYSGSYHNNRDQVKSESKDHYLYKPVLFNSDTKKKEISAPLINTNFANKQVPFEHGPEVANGAKQGYDVKNKNDKQTVSDSKIKRCGFFSSLLIKDCLMSD